MTEADEMFRKRVLFCLQEARQFLDESRSGEITSTRTDPDGTCVDLLPGRIAHLERAIATYEATLQRIDERAANT